MTIPQMSTIDEAVDAVRAGSANLEVLANYTAFRNYGTARGRVRNTGPG